MSSSVILTVVSGEQRLFDFFTRFWWSKPSKNAKTWLSTLNGIKKTKSIINNNYKKKNNSHTHSHTLSF